MLDAAHALMDQGVFRYRRPPKPSRARARKPPPPRWNMRKRLVVELWRTLPAGVEPPAAPPTPEGRGEFGRRYEAARGESSLLPGKAFANAEITELSLPQNEAIGIIEAVTIFKT